MTERDSGTADTQISKDDPWAEPGDTLEPLPLPARYDVKQILGRGGMGEVLLAFDHETGRDIALKTMRHDTRASTELAERFIREARVQAQLEHPAIVPVYDLTVRDGGSSFFTMKRVQGHTLREIFTGLRTNNPQHTANYTQRKLLSALSAICLAIDFAHQRGVIHRDLKPQNIMIGDFGEVYVLDWGLTKLTEEATPAAPTTEAIPQRIVAPQSEETRYGHLMGTLGYTAPERLIPPVSTPKPTVDVFALGAILFELLTLEALIPQAEDRTMVEATLRLDANKTSPTTRTPTRSIAPELDTICARALHPDPNNRLQTARELHEAIERFLDGDRDLELRKKLACEHARVSLSALAEDRARALNEAGKALALDPTNTEAAALAAKILLEPPAQTPPEVEEDLENKRQRAIQWQATVGVVGYLFWLALLPLMFWMGIRDPYLLGAMMIFVLIALALDIANSRRLIRPDVGMALVLAFQMLLVVLTTRSLGPWIAAPGLATASLTGLIIHGRTRWRLIVLLSALAAVFGPVALELLGVLPPTFSLTENQLRILPSMLDFEPTPTLIMLVFAIFATLLIPALSMMRVRDQSNEAQRQLAIQAWHLRRLLPNVAPVPPPG